MNTTIPIYIIYKHTCIITGKSYIGQTSKGIVFRWNAHISTAKYGSDFHIHRAIRKHGEDNFTHEILFETTDQNIINEKEIEYIAEYDTFHDGYNMTIGGEAPMRGFTLSEETKEKISISKKGKKFSKEHIRNMMGNKNALGNKLNKITRKKMSKSHLGKKHSEISKEKRRGKNHSSYRGDYHTPQGLFSSSKLAATDLICATTIRIWCKNPDKIITEMMIRKSIYLQQLPESPLGKTFKEIGFWF